MLTNWLLLFIRIIVITVEILFVCFKGVESQYYKLVVESCK